MLAEQKLHKIRHRRQENAQIALAAANRLLRQARQAEAQARRHAEQFACQRIKQVAALYDDLIGQPTTIRSIHALKQKESLLAEEESAHFARADEAARQREEKQAGQQQALTALGSARKQCSKAENLLERYHRRQKEAQLRHEDAQMDEFAEQALLRQKMQ